MAERTIKQTKFPSKWLIIGAMMSFLGTAFLIIAINSIVFRHGFHPNLTISRYVGMEIWSALVFALSNIFVTMFIGRYLWQLGQAWQMPKLYYCLVIFQAVTLLALSACPVGMFDVTSTAPSVISWIHNLSARAMFLTMMLIAAMVVFCRRANVLAHVFNAFYVLYAAICIFGHFAERPWFVANIMFIEAAYLFGFMLAMAFCDKRLEHLLESVKL